mmetsp:Transcript_15142/g.42978  ORF Transcript_15142/g.42978 Transcript_15142/m.42978 type:complete len:179 (+) Transcript_15142:72-608(+)|eukprot:CAMPEP_0170268668 /NCGR_PEP_ID=MMETSP0116_2-20130129/34267_1 /TAXON_ID=400756 /ORGANISM="Durinskia baltica, Strain CSIRO CS-38" /LENGTH=178 /DNA_ID=CAMNT_0010519837 /DNA_START=65 /DNA_END=601 /DNA_ORIENTATION=-
MAALLCLRAGRAGAATICFEAAPLARGPVPAGATGAFGASQRLCRFSTASPPEAIKVPSAPEEGGRTVVDGPQGPIIVAKVGGEYFAVDGTCPHMKKSMKAGKIEAGPDGPTLTCRLHNSSFNMKSGKCVKWVTGALGFESSVVGGLVGKLGGEKCDIQAYKVVESEDGGMWLEASSE